MLQYFKYKLPFRTPFKTSSKEYSHREGILLIYKEGNIEAYGDIAPLPGFSSESLDDIRKVLTMNHRSLEKSIRGGEGADSLSLLNRIHSFPSLTFGLDMLLHDLAAKSEGKSLSDYLYGEKAPKLRCNFTLPLTDTETAVTTCREKEQEGFDTVKIKTGKDFKEELELISAIRDEFSDLKIRIDANGAWSKKEAIDHLQALENLDIEYCEQPVDSSKPDVMAAVREASPVPVAADESVNSKNDAIRLIGEQAADIMILKPMMFGLIREMSVTKQLAASHDIDIVFTTLLESAAGRDVTASLARGLGSSKYAHGLATGSLLEKDIVKNDKVENGSYVFTDEPGIGTQIDKDLLSEVSS